MEVNENPATVNVAGSLYEGTVHTWIAGMVSWHSKLHSCRLHRGAACHGSQPGHSQGQETEGQPAKKQKISENVETDFPDLCIIMYTSVTCRGFSFLGIEDIDLLAASADAHICPKTGLNLCCAWCCWKAKLCQSLNSTPSFHSHNREEETVQSACVAHCGNC